MLMMTTTNINIQREKERKKERWNAVTMESLTNQRRTGIVCWCVASIYYIPSRNDLTRLDSRVRVILSLAARTSSRRLFFLFISFTTASNS